MDNQIHSDTKKKMDHSIEMFKTELASVRTGRAHVGLLAQVSVNYYGTPTPLSNIAQVHVPDPQTLTVTPFDKASLKEIEKSIRESDLGLNPSADGSVIRVPVPVLTQERRKDLVKHVKKAGEDCKIVIRNIRRDGNEKLKKLEKDKQITQDQERDAQEKIQELTDHHVKTIDQMVQAKEKELMTV
ncbi:MAG: ribosome recycling factor [Deltaproteobacteria bacterium]|nr:ribosome recycling factor [Deltaproteobacteria bacterium]